MGLTVDNKLTWKNHVAALNKKLGSCTALMYNLENKVTPEVKIAVYKSLFESVMRYGINVWGTAANSHLKIINNLQKRCLRALGLRMDNNNQVDTKYCIGLYKLLTPKGIFTYNVLIKNHGNSVYKIKSRRPVQTRNVIKYITPIPNTMYGQRLTEYLVPYLFNRLPTTIENIQNKKAYKIAVFEWLSSSEVNLP